MQYIDESVISRCSPKELVEYFKTNNLDLNSPINITIGGKDYGDISYCILDELKYSINKAELFKEFIEAGADVNIIRDDDNIFINILQAGDSELLEICMPHFKLKYNTNIMYEAHTRLRNSCNYNNRFISLVKELVSKFDKEKWKRKSALFSTNPKYTAKTSKDYFDSEIY